MSRSNMYGSQKCDDTDWRVVETNGYFTLFIELRRVELAESKKKKETDTVRARDTTSTAHVVYASNNIPMRDHDS